ncbi:unnamed protein product [Diamesa hyperborea]
MRGNCSICLSKLVEGDKNAFAITCGHIFHHKCIRTWMTGQDSCPACRKKCSVHQLVRLHWDQVGGLDEKEEAYVRNRALTSNITKLTNQIKTKNEKFQELEKVISKVSVCMSSIAFNNQQLKQKNEEMKEILGEMSTRRKIADGADEAATKKDMMIEKLRYKVRLLKKKVRQEDDEAMSDSDDDADDEAEYDSSEGAGSLTFNELFALNLPTSSNRQQTGDNNIADDTDDDIANNGRDIDIDDDIEIDEPVSQPIQQNPTPQEPIPCQPSTSKGIIYHMFEYQTPFD